jgi:hypothetical protein
MKSNQDSGSIERYAVRILMILYYCRDYPNDGYVQLSLDLNTENDADLWRIDSETKLQKIDFWLRYPDHLSAALLNLVEKGENQRKDQIKAIVQKIFNDDEPVIHWIPMRKYLRGAYEPLDNVISYLSSRSMVHRRLAEKGKATKYFLEPKGKNAVEQMLSACPSIYWYAERCKLINDYFEKLSGHEIRNMQYLDQSYSGTAYLTTIDTIESQVKEKFTQIYGETL